MSEEEKRQQSWGVPGGPTPPAGSTAGWPGAGPTSGWPVPDPAAAGGTSPQAWPPPYPAYPTYPPYPTYPAYPAYPAPGEYAGPAAPVSPSVPNQLASSTGPWAWQSPPPAASRRKKIGMLAVGLLAACVVFGAIAVAVPGNKPGAGARSGSPAAGGTFGGSVTSTSSVDPSGGKVVFTEDFKSNLSGWYKGASRSGAAFDYTANGYTVVASAKDWVHFSTAPSKGRYQQVSMTMTARLDAGAPSDAGLGLECDGGSSFGAVAYEFVVSPDGYWYVGRRNAGSTDPPTVVDTGIGETFHAYSPMKIQAVCATLDGGSARLILVVDGKVITDTKDRGARLPAAGWSVGIAAAGSSSGTTTMRTFDFEERDLSAAS